MSEQAVMEPAPAQTAQPRDEQPRDEQPRDEQPRDEQSAPPAARDGDEALIADELLVEEVSIDGMCGVY